MSEAATATPPTITTKDVEEWCALAQVKDGRKIFQKGDVLRPWCGGIAVHAEVQGSGATPYRIDITFKDGANKPSPKCSCPAWRSNPFCKHVTAVLLAWATKPESFAVVEAPAVEVKAKPARPKKAESDTRGAASDAPKKAKTDEQADAGRTALIESGLTQATDLLSEICARGLMAATPEQADAVLKLAELLISQKLVKLGRATQMLSIRLRQLTTAKTNRRGAQPEVDERDFAALLADAWLILAATRRALQADPASADNTIDFEDLLGTSFSDSRLDWTNRKAVLEVAFEEITNEIGHVIGTSYLLDLDSSELMLERKIVPEKIAERERKRPYHCLLTKCDVGSSRSQPPRRVKINCPSERKLPITAEALTRATRHAVTTVAVLRRRLAMQTVDPLAPRDLLALFAPEALQVIDAPPAQGRGSQSLLLVDAEGIALPVESVSAANIILGIVTREPILALFGRLKLNERGDAFVFAPLSILCRSGKLQTIG